MTTTDTTTTIATATTVAYTHQDLEAFERAYNTDCDVGALILNTGRAVDGRPYGAPTEDLLARLWRDALRSRAALRPGDVPEAELARFDADLDAAYGAVSAAMERYGERWGREIAISANPPVAPGTGRWVAYTTRSGWAEFVSASSMGESQYGSHLIIEVRADAPPSVGLTYATRAEAAAVARGSLQVARKEMADYYARLG
jgi:hypothetical protein